MKKLLIFDLDGTLLNTIDDITNSLNYALTDLNLRCVSVDEAKYLVGSGVKILIDRALKLVLGIEYESKRDLYYDSLSKLYQDYYTVNQNINTKPYPNITNLLKALKNKNYQIAVLSNKPHFDVIKIIKSYFNEIKFDYVLGASNEIRIKPYPDGVCKIINDLKIKKEDAIYIGDSDVDVKTGHNAGLDMIACLWGFRKEDEIRNANYLVSDALEILKIVGE